MTSPLPALCPQHIHQTAPEMLGRGAMVHQSTNDSPDVEGPASFQTLPSIPSSLMTLIPSVSYLWGRIQHFPCSKKKGKRLMARRKPEKRFKEDVLLHI